MKLRTKLRSTFDPYIKGNERSVHGALTELTNNEGRLKDILDMHHKFKKERVIKSLNKLIKKGFVEKRWMNNEEIYYLVYFFSQEETEA